MRLALQNRSSAEPSGSLRWIESRGTSVSERAPQFLPLPKGEGRGEGEGKLEKHPTSNIEHRTSNGSKPVNSLDFGCSMLDVRRSQKNRAFTLIELVIVIVIIGIAAAVIIPEMKGGYQDALLRSTTRELVNVFNIASSRAVSLNQLHRVRIEAGTGRYVIEKRTRESVQGDEYKPLNDVSEAEGTLDKRISVSVHNLDESQTAAPASEASQTRADIDSISFYSDGTADSAELLLRDKQGYRMVLHINAITSHVKILELGRE
jgi:prepilin-type N-terminal cleavage/methylation domain-containing protein